MVIYSQHFGTCNPITACCVFDGEVIDRVDNSRYDYNLKVQLIQY